MKGICLVALMVCTFSGAFAQNYNAGSAAAPSGVNGFRTVSEENALMEQLITEKRKKEREESGLPPWKQQTEKKHEQASPAKKHPVSSRPKQTVSRKH